MDDEKIWINISVDGGVVRRMPLRALRSSPVLYKMATCGMKETLEGSIVLSNDSPIALEVFCKLSMIWMLEDDIFPRCTLIRIRTIRRDEFHDIVEFMDKYQACNALWSAVQRSIESYLDDENLLVKMVEFESRNPNVAWGQNTINRLLKEKTLSCYTESFGISTTRRILSAVLNMKNS